MTYFICLTHNKIRVRGKWISFRENVRIIMRRHMERRRMFSVRTACNNCTSHKDIR